jgi:transposase
MHVLSDANGLRHAPYRGRYFKPQRLHADKAYDRADLRRWLRWKRIGVRIARKGIESSNRLGRRRWGIERTMSRLSGYRRLSPRYERNPRNHVAFLGLVAACAATSDSSASPHRTRSYWPAGGSPPRERKPGRSPRTRTSTPSWPGSSTRSMSGRTGRSPSTSSDRWVSARPPAPAGPGKAARTGCRRPTAAPTESPTSMAATRSATTSSGASTAGARASTTPGRP